MTTTRRTVRATNFELARVLAGHTLVFLADDGSEVTVRLYESAQELLAEQAEALGRTFPDDPAQRRTAALSEPHAEHLTRPIKLVTA